MKNSINKILATVAFCAAAIFSGVVSSAQNVNDGTYEETNGIAFVKRASINNDGTYTIDLETFVTGEVTQEFESVPVDVVLVLDVSGSMDEAISSVSSYEIASVNSIKANEGPTSWGSVVYPWETDYYYNYNGNYYRVWVGRGGNGGWGGSRRYYLYFTVNGRTYYINTSGNVVTNEPTNVTSDSANLLSSNVQLYTQETTTTTKMDALKSAVGAFIDEIYINDVYEKYDPQYPDDPIKSPKRKKNGVETPLGNQISIVKFGSATYNGSTTDATITPGNHFNHLVYQYQGGWGGGGWYQTLSEYTTGYQDPIETNTRIDLWYNCSEVLSGFTPTAATSDVNSLKGAVDNLVSSGATAADYGMNLAYMLINTLGEDRANSNKTVVFFTDGAPTHGSEYDANVASAAITNSNSIKAITYGEGDDATHPTVYSVGVFSGTVTDQIRNFMTGVASGSDHFFNASGGTAEDLKDIFTAIAHTAGGSGNTSVSGGSAVTVDIVSTSFSVPKGFQENPGGAITVLVAPCTGVTTIDNKDYLTFGAEMAPGEYGLDPIEPSINEATNKVSTTGFDFSKWWCGPDPTSATGYHGYKQIIRFVVTLNEDAIGGPGVATNDSDSGIYLEGQTEPLVKFNRPTVKVPVQIWIKKEGLKSKTADPTAQGHEDSAVFTLRRTKYLGSYQTDANGNAILDGDGKPLHIDYIYNKANPAKATVMGVETTITWETFTKVTVNMTSDNPDGIVKISGLNADYIYRIEEDAWAHLGYDFDPNATARYTMEWDPVKKEYKSLENPFTFTNTPKGTVYAEDVIRNEFDAVAPLNGTLNANYNGFGTEENL